MRVVVFFLLLASLASAQTPPLPAGQGPSVVYVAHDPLAIKRYETNDPVVRAMVNRLVMAVTNRADVTSAWRSLVTPQDRVGIKISAAGGRIFTTHRAVVNAIASGLAAAGVPRNNIIVWDRNLTGARAAGYENGLYRLESIAPREGYDPKATVSAPGIGRLIWGDLEYVARTSVPLSDEENTSTLSHFARVLTKEVTKVINVPVVSDSETNGVAGCIYNMTIPNLDNWRRFTQGNRFSAGGLAEVYADPIIRGKVVLNLMDGLIAEYAGGPATQPSFQIHHATLYASRDPVALDALALRQIDKWRLHASLPSLMDRAADIENAAALGLGQGNPDKISVRTVWP
ncbi:MAG: DUF362 domain-containing protein [Verrucomicrobiota bacterium]